MQTGKRSESGIGSVTKHYIHRKDKSIRGKLDVDQWRNTQATITWFKDIKSKSRFLPLHIKGSLLKAINFAKSVIPIQDKFIQTILHSRKALLFNKNDVWVKKDNTHFAVPIGSYGGANVCEYTSIKPLPHIIMDLKLVASMKI